MSLVIEDGTVVVSAQSYVTVAEVVAYASQRGVALSLTSDAHVEILIHRAMDFLEAQEARFQGSRVSPDQELSWPRKDVVVNGFEVEGDTLPPLLKKALCQLVLDADTLDLMPNGDGREIIREKVDVLETQYAQRGVTAPQPSLTAFFTLLGPLLDAGGVFSLEIERC